jgi:hypothetical protein
MVDAEVIISQHLADRVAFRQSLVCFQPGLDTYIRGVPLAKFSRSDLERHIKRMRATGAMELEVTPRNVDEARELLFRLIVMQKELRSIKEEIYVDVKIIQRHYAGQLARLKTDTGRLLRWANPSRQAQKEIARERDQLLLMYEEVQRSLNDVLEKVDDARQEMTWYIEASV